MLRTMTIATVLLLAGALSAPAALAQDEGTATTDHPIVGAWVVDVTPPNPGGQPELTLFHPSGTMIDLGPEGIALGSWAATGERTADITLNAPVVVPDFGYLGLVTLRARVEVAEDGQTFTASYTQENPIALAQAFGLPEGELGPGEATGRRIAVEPMGEPVGPIPEEPGAEMSPAPEASPAG